MKLKKITIIGLGLIGGSLAKSFKENSICEELIGIDNNFKNIGLAMNEGFVNAGYSQIPEEIFDSDIIFICTPVMECIKIIKLLSRKIRKNCIVTDVCSTKELIMNSLKTIPNAPNFIGGHPMAGCEKSGFSQGSARLFQNAVYILTPHETSTKEDVNKLTQIIKKIGAKPTIMKSAEHDEMMSGVSHTPHVIASALVNLLRESGTGLDKFKHFIGSGFVDTTRIASSNPVMWEQILMSNSKNILATLDAFGSQIENLKMDIINANSEKINEFFRNAKEYREELI